MLFQYYAHKSILFLTLKNETDDLLNKIKINNDEDLIELVLYYCYSNCLPSTNINQNKSNIFLNFIQQFKNLNNLQVLLTTLFSNLTFKKRKLNNNNTFLRKIINYKFQKYLRL